jgi:lyso-ornithine lipid O-acyltransferase
MPTMRAVILALLCALLTFLLIPLQWLSRFLRLPLTKTIPQFYHQAVCKFLNIKITVEGDIGNTPNLVVANHVTWLDIPVIGSIWPVHFVAKKEVGTWPVFASLAKLQNTIFVDRGRRQSTLASRDEIRTRIQNGDTVVLFPEGTSNNGREVLPFKSTFFSVVENTNLRVVALTLVYETQRGLPMMRRQRPSVAWVGDTEMAPHLWQFLKSGPITVRIIVHKPSKSENRKVMAKTAHAEIKTTLVEALRGMR